MLYIKNSQSIYWNPPPKKVLFLHRTWYLQSSSPKPVREAYTLFPGVLFLGGRAQSIEDSVCRSCYGIFQGSSMWLMELLSSQPTSSCHTVSPAHTLLVSVTIVHLLIICTSLEDCWTSSESKRHKVDQVQLQNKQYTFSFLLFKWLEKKHVNPFKWTNSCRDPAEALPGTLKKNF